MGKRLFLAVRPPASVIDELETYIEPRRDADPELRWAQPEHWHVTLAFLGDEVTDDQVDRLLEHLAAPAGRTSPFRLTLFGGGYFRFPGAIKQLLLGVRDGAAELEALAMRCRTAAARANIQVNAARYQPHLTLARSRRGAAIAARRWLPVIDSFGAFSWDVTEFVLIDSELTQGGPRHRVMERFVLGDPRLRGDDSGEDRYNDAGERHERNGGESRSGNGGESRSGNGGESHARDSQGASDERMPR